MRVEEIAIRQEVRQMLNEAGINRNTLKDMALDALNEKLDKAVYQAMREKDIDGSICNRIENCIGKRRTIWLGTKSGAGLHVFLIE